jgi:Ser/Thr protein kinase RdoA (MazF antagonist)
LNPAFPAAHFFLSKQDIDNLEPFGTGNVNDTFLVTLHFGKQLILQRVNPAVFQNPQLVQHNIRFVTNHLNREIHNQPGLKNQFIPLILLSGKNGDTYHDEDGAVWRLVNYIPGKTHETITQASQAQELGRCLGLFHKLLSTFDSSELTNNLPGFHNTPAYLDQYDQAQVKLEKNHDPETEFCHQFIRTHRALATLLDNVPGLSRNVIHGDPKVANFIFNQNSEKVISLIDLDTVRHGLLLHDIGDALRSCCNSMGESPSVSDYIHFAPDLFTSWLNGYLSEVELLLTNGDKAHIVQAIQVIAFELGLRFLTDHLAGDHYFKIQFPGHNLLRARVQFHLVQSIEDQLENLQSIVTQTNS